MKKIVWIMVAILVVVGLVACTGTTTPTSTPQAPATMNPSAQASTAAQASAVNSNAGVSAAPKGTGVYAYPLFGSKTPAAQVKIGYSELSSADPWRVAQIGSMQSEADKRGANYTMIDAQNKADKQLADIEDLVAQGCQFIFFSPLNTDGFQAALDAAKAKQVPIVTIDREVTGVYGTDMVCAVLADFIIQGLNCAQWLDANIQGDINVVQITGQPGGSDVRDRTKGFADEMAKINAKGGHKMTIVASQNGQWSRTVTQSVLQNVIQSVGKTGFNAIYCQNDEMAMGAALALKAAGIPVGTDAGGVQIVTVDGQKQAIQYVVDGKIAFISTCTPLFGPAAFGILDDYLNGKQEPNIVYNQEKKITIANAADEYKVAWGNP